MATRLHTRGHWFKEHIQHPSHKGRVKHDLQVPHHSTSKVEYGTKAGLLEAGKMHSIVALMKTHKLDWLALTETHMKQQDQCIIDGYTFTHSANEELDDHIKPKQTFTGVSVVTAPHLTPAVIDLTLTHGRLLSFTLDTVEAPLTVYVVYAPHNQREQEVRDAFWEELTATIQRHKRSQPFMIVHDFNALLLDDHAPSRVPWDRTWEKTKEEEENVAAGEGDSNQLRFFELLFQEDLCLPQSWMEKPHKQRVTHVRPSGDKVQLDHVVTPVQWRNMVTDVKTVQDAALNSNHFLVKVQTNLRTKASKRKPPTPKRLRSATEKVVHAFNKAVQAVFNANADTSQRGEATPQPHAHADSSAQRPSQDQPTNTEQSYARLSSTRGPRRSRRKRRRPASLDHPNHVGAHTATLTSPGQQDQDLETQLHKNIRAQARRDRVQWLKERLAESERTMDARQKWKWIKRNRSDYRPRPVKPVSQTKQAQTFAQHLADKQWAQPVQGYTGPRTPLFDTAEMDTGPFTVEELDAALHKASRNKAVGLDDILTEAWQWLTEDNRQKLLDILNQALTAGHIPQEWQQALVVEIYKGKGSTADPNNYRPISLLSTAYKLMARIIQQRLEKAIDHRLRDTQFGFRARLASGV